MALDDTENSNDKLEAQKSAFGEHLKEILVRGHMCISREARAIYQALSADMVIHTIPVHIPAGYGDSHNPCSFGSCD
jgi:hypothetical protein